MARRPRVFASGLVLFTAASLLCGTAGTIEMLDGARALQGVGGAILFAVSALASLVPARRAASVNPVDALRAE